MEQLGENLSESGEQMSGGIEWEGTMAEAEFAPIDDIEFEVENGDPETDKQIRAGMLAQVRVDLGDSVFVVANKLARLKLRGQPAFAMLNNIRMDNLASGDEEELVSGYKEALRARKVEHMRNDAGTGANETAEAGSAEEVLASDAAGSVGETLADDVEALARKTFEALDRPETREELGCTDTAVAELVGVHVGLKEGGMFNLYLDDEHPARQEEMGRVFDDLGLSYAAEEYVDERGNPKVSFTYGRDEATVAKINELIAESKREKQSGAATRELGRVLGYPATATEYFLRRSRDYFVDGKPLVAPPQGYRFYIHSPEHQDEEFEEYDAKVYQFLAEYCPRVAEEMAAESDKRWAA